MVSGIFLIVAGIVGIVMLGLIVLIMSSFRAVNKKEIERKERAILQQVLAYGGKVTPLEIAANVDQSFEEVKATWIDSVIMASGSLR